MVKQSKQEILRQRQYRDKLTYGGSDKLSENYTNQKRILTEQESYFEVTQFLILVLAELQNKKPNLKKVALKFNSLIDNSYSHTSILTPPSIKYIEGIRLYFESVILGLNTLNSNNSVFSYVQNLGSEFDYKKECISLIKKYFINKGYVSGETSYTVDANLIRYRDWCGYNNISFPFENVRSEISSKRMSDSAKKLSENSKKEENFLLLTSAFQSYLEEDASLDLEEYSRICNQILNANFSSKQSGLLNNLKRKINKRYEVYSEYETDRIVIKPKEKEKPKKKDRNFGSY